MVRLSKISIENYRSCIDTEFQPTPEISILIGANGSGKTNVLNSLRLLKELANSKMNYSRRNTDFASETKLKTEYDIDGKKIIHYCNLAIDNVAGNRDEIVGEDHSWYLYDFIKSKKRVSVPLETFELIERYGLLKNSTFKSSVKAGNLQLNLYKGLLGGSRKSGGNPLTNFELINKEAVDGVNSISTFWKGLKYYSATQFTNPKTCPISFEIESLAKSNRGIRIRGHGKFLFDLYESRKSEGYQDFLDIVGPNGLGLIDDIYFNEVETASVEVQVRSGGTVSQKKQEKMLIVPQFQIGNNKLSPNQLSDGTFKTITLLFYVITEASTILLIEEPEVCVHHGLLSSTIEVIRTYSRGKQIIISTHSDYILDRLDPNQVFLIKNDRIEGTKVGSLKRELTSSGFKALNEYLANQGNLGEYWKHGGFD